MNWLRTGGVRAQLRGLLLLFVFAIGSILARDVVLYQQVLAIRAASAACAIEAAPKAKARPSGISKRAAWSPFDPPDDDDETDQDSDSLAARPVLVTLPPAPMALIGTAPFVERARIARVVDPIVTLTLDRLQPPRGPPAV